jgi:hypothetical protein
MTYRSVRDRQDRAYRNVQESEKAVDGDENMGYVTDERAEEMVMEATQELRAALENCRMLAARHRHEEWAQHVLRYCAEIGFVGNPLRDEVKP